MRSRPASLAIGALLGVAAPLGCNALLGDWEVEPAGTASATGSASASASGTGGGGGGAAPVGAKPLQAEPVAPAGIAVFRDGHFRIEAEPASMWQWARWFHLPSDTAAEHPLGPVLYTDETPVFRTTCLWTGVRTHGADDPEGFSVRSCPIAPGDDSTTFVEGGGQWPELDALMLPAWYTVGGETQGPWGGITNFRSRVFASGRVWTWTRFENTHSAALVDNAEMIFGLIGLRADDFHLPTADAPGLFAMKSGGGGLLAIDTGRLRTEEPGPTPGATFEADALGLEGDGVAGWWKVVVDLTEGEVQTLPFAFFLGSNPKLAAERAARQLDLRSPGLEAVAGASTVHVTTGGLDPQTGTYSLTRERGASEVVFRLLATTLESDAPAAIARFEPAFEIDNWTSRSWVIRLGTTVLGSNEAQGSDLLASHAGNRLGFQYLGVIDADAADEPRTFTVAEH